MNNFAVFILTNGRSDRVFTYNALKKAGYSGKIYLIVDNEDKELEEYKNRYKDEIIIFNKQDAIDYTDSGDNLQKRNSVVYARNWNFIIAKELGIDYFWQLDDDYSEFGWATDENENYVTSSERCMKKLDLVMQRLIDFMDISKATSIAFAQGGDFIGGENGSFVKKVQNGTFARKVMNSFLFKTSNPVKFMGRINEDVNMYVLYGNKGHLFITVPRLRLWQKETQSNSGGLTDIYLDLGTYVKSFYSVMYAPSCVKVIEMGTTNKRLHHRISWKNAVPVILDEKYKK